MKITNLTSKKLYLGFVGTNGISLEVGQSIVVDDSYASNPSLDKMVKDNYISKDSFSASDETTLHESNFVTSSEFNSFIKGLYVVPSTWSSSGVVSASATAKSITGTQIGPFDTSYKNVLYFKFDGLNTVLVELPKGQIDITTSVNFLNSHTIFSKYGVASSDAGKLKITSKVLGTNSNIEILAEERSAVASFYLTAPVVVSPTGTAATVTIPTVNPTGLGIQSIRHAIKIYTTDVGTSVITTEMFIQRVTKGLAISGLTTAEATVDTSSTGEITFEVAAPGAIAGHGWIEVVIPTSHYFAQVPTNRLQVI